MRIRFKQPIPVRVTETLYVSDEAIDFETGLPHPERGGVFAEKGQRGKLLEIDSSAEESALVRFDDDDIDSSLPLTFLSPASTAAEQIAGFGSLRSL